MMQAMPRIRFEGTLEPGPGGGAFVALPSSIQAALGGRGRFRVRGSLRGVEFSSSTMPASDGGCCLGIHKAVREAAGAAFGEVLELELERDDAPRQVEMPDDLVAALEAD